MSLKTITRCLIAVGCAGIVPLYAQTQTTATTGTVTTTKMHKVEHKATTETKETKATEKKETKAEEKKETKAEEKMEMKAGTKTPHRMTHTMAMSGGSRLYNDSTRLAALLTDAQSKVDVSPAVWKTVANEANTLANRVAASAKGAKTRNAATEARKHVREMHAAALKGDAAGARTHAAEALPYVYTVIDANAPRSM